MDIPITMDPRLMGTTITTTLDHHTTIDNNNNHRMRMRMTIHYDVDCGWKEIPWHHPWEVPFR